MAIIKAVSSGASIGRAVNYITEGEKTANKLISGKDCNPATAIEEIKATKEIWGKTNGRQYYHFVQSFAPNEKITTTEAHEIAQKLAEERFKGHEVVIATHQDKDHIHTHFIVNSVNHENGYKLHWSKHELQRMKDMSDTICQERGKSICEKKQEISAYTNGKYKVLEKGLTSGYKSYVLDCYKTVSAIKDIALSREDFIARMKEQGYETNWSDSRKHITFTDKNGNKVRASNLEKTFSQFCGKEDLELKFINNLKKSRTSNREIEQLRDVRIPQLNVVRTDNVINRLNCTSNDSYEQIFALADSVLENMQIFQLERQDNNHDGEEKLAKMMGEEGYERWKYKEKLSMER